MTTQEILNIVLQVCAGGGIVALDATAVVFMFVQGKIYLTKLPAKRDYEIYTPKARRDEVMDRDKKMWREVGRRLYRWLIPVILASLLLVALCIVMSTDSGARGA